MEVTFCCSGCSCCEHTSYYYCCCNVLFLFCIIESIFDLIGELPVSSSGTDGLAGGMVVETNLKEVTGAIEGMERFQTATEALMLGSTSTQARRK
jgi:hypothetical protein